MKAVLVGLVDVGDHYEIALYVGGNVVTLHPQQVASVVDSLSLLLEGMGYTLIEEDEDEDDDVTEKVH